MTEDKTDKSEEEKKETEEGRQSGGREERHTETRQANIQLLHINNSQILLIPNNCLSWESFKCINTKKTIMYFSV